VCYSRRRKLTESRRNEIKWQTRKKLVRIRFAVVPLTTANTVALHAKARATPLILIATADIRSAAESSNRSGSIIETDKGRIQRPFVIELSRPSFVRQVEKLRREPWACAGVFVFEEKKCFVPILIAKSLHPIR